MQRPVGWSSAPVTAMNRIFGDWIREPYVSKVCKVANLGSMSFHDVIDAMSDMLYDRRTGRGRVIVTLPGRITERSAIDLITLGADVDDARQYLQNVVLPRIRSIVARGPSP